MTLFLLTTLALAQDAPLSEAQEPPTRPSTEQSASAEALADGLVLEVQATDPVQTGLGLLWAACEGQPDALLREACLGDLEQLALLFEDALEPDVVLLSQAGALKRRTKGGFVVDINGIEACEAAPSNGSEDDVPWYLVP